MSDQEGTNTINKTARWAGLLYLLIIPFSVFGILYVPARLVVSGDAATTVANIVASEGLFRGAILSNLIAQTVFVLVPLALYKLLAPVNKNHAVLMVVLALLAVPIAFINELNRFAVLLVLSAANSSTAFESQALHAQVMMFLDLHGNGIQIAQILWGLWLFPLGILVFNSGFLPRVLGVLLWVGGFGYLVDVPVAVLFPGFDLTISPFTFVGELLLPLWLVFRGVNVERWKRRTLAAP